jgi:hypothetical protein
MPRQEELLRSSAPAPKVCSSRSRIASKRAERVGCNKADGNAA